MLSVTIGKYVSSRVQQKISCNWFETYFQRHIAVVCSFIIKNYFSYSLIAVGMRSLPFLLVSLLLPFHLEQYLPTLVNVTQCLYNSFLPVISTGA